MPRRIASLACVLALGTAAVPAVAQTPEPATVPRETVPDGTTQSPDAGAAPTEQPAPAQEQPAAPPAAAAPVAPPPPLTAAPAPGGDGDGDGDGGRFPGASPDPPLPPEPAPARNTPKAEPRETNGRDAGAAAARRAAADDDEADAAAAGLAGALGGTATVPSMIPSFFIGSFGIPPFLLPIYQAAGVEYGVRWEVLAAINAIETDFGRNLAVSSAGALGWMQFIPSSWESYGVDANADGFRDPYNPVDAIFAAARYLRAAGAADDLRNALFAYNHATWYVDAVLARARRIAAVPDALVGALTGLTQGRSPVFGRTVYAGPRVDPAPRRSIHLYAAPGAAAVAVQDGEIVRVGTSRRLGRFVVLRDGYGNAYTYAHLGRVARHVVAVRERALRSSAAAARLALPTTDPRPTVPATAGNGRAGTNGQAGTNARAGSSARAGSNAQSGPPAQPSSRSAARAGSPAPAATGPLAEPSGAERAGPPTPAAIGPSIERAGPPTPAAIGPSTERAGPPTPAAERLGPPTPPAAVLARASRSAMLAQASRSAAPAKERLFAHPARPRPLRSGGQRQLLEAGRQLPESAQLRAYLTGPSSLRRDDVELKPLVEGRRVIAGTILGRVGTGTSTRRAHLLFEIRPAGRDAPRIDPKPILDGWRRLESTALRRATSTDAPERATIGQILLMSKATLVRRVLANPAIEIYACGRRDIAAGIVDRRVLATLEYLAANGLNPTVSSLRCGHGFFTANGRISQHSHGSAVDIVKINGVPVLGNQGPGSIVDAAIRRLLLLQGTLAPAQIISLMRYEGVSSTLALPDHADHLHIGFRSDDLVAGPGASPLRPAQWSALLRRIGRITSPRVVSGPSPYALKVRARGG